MKRKSVRYFPLQVATGIVGGIGLITWLENIKWSWIPLLVGVVLFGILAGLIILKDKGSCDITTKC